MPNGRKVSHDIKYSGNSIIAYINPFVTGVSYTDNMTGAADDVTINLADKNRLWLGSWLPTKGASLEVSLIVSTGWGNTKSFKRSLGYFEIDETSGGGPPTTVSIKGNSVPQSSSLKGTKKSRSWENSNLKKVIKDIAKKNGMSVYFYGEDETSYDRLDQESESDGAFIYRITNDAGFALKIANKKIYVMDEAKLESEAHVAIIKQTDKNIKSWGYKDTLSDIYKSCKVSYTDSTKKKTYKYTFTPSNPPATSKVLIVNEEVKSNADAKRLAKKKLREKNKEATTFSITLYGVVPLYAGQTVKLEEFGKLSGKYIITSVKGTTGSGSSSTLDLRKCLGGY